MSGNQIEEGNRLIGTFMGKRLTDSAIEAAFDDATWHVSELKYHEDWNRLMPVVEKIEDMEYDFIIDAGHVILMNIDEGYQYDDIGTSKMESVWSAIVQFIQWYNQNTK